MLCPACRHENRVAARFCDSCGAALAPTCPSCGAQARAGARFCDSCGAALGTTQPVTAQPAAPATAASAPSAAAAGAAAAERRRVTVLFCDLVDSVPLSARLDPEDLAAVLRVYHQTCEQVIAPYEGHIAQYLGDGLLVYFGYPVAHEADAQRAVRAGLAITQAIEQLNPRLEVQHGVRLQVRAGVHTGLVVAGEVGSGSAREQLALGETPNIAARLQALAPPNGIVVSAGTRQLVAGYFAFEDLGDQALKGLAQPVHAYRVLAESAARTRLDVASAAGLTPLVGRQHELALLQERWAQARAGLGQVVVLAGEAGIGKSRLVRSLQEHVAQDAQAWMTPLQCSPYHQHTALYPFVDLMERVALQFEREETPAQRLRKLEGWLPQYGLPLAEAVPLFASLLSLPLDEHFAPLDLSPQQQRRKLLETILTIFGVLTARQPVLVAMEDLHWADPTTLELIDLLVEQTPASRLLLLCTCRPEFDVPWTGRSRVAQVTLSRLPHVETEALAERVAGGRSLPAAVSAQIVEKTDGVPLFVEELTRSVLESGLLREVDGQYQLAGPLPPLAIPATLHDSLLARLDRLAAVKEIAQLAAAIGREFPYELLSASASALGIDEPRLRDGLAKLAGAELIYQRGLPPRATYLFKHALVRDAAYESLLRSRRQQFHLLIGRTLETHFPDTVEQQPEVVAHHYGEAGLPERALPYWRQAGERALARSALREAAAHLRRAIEVLGALPETVQRVEHELALQIALGAALLQAEGYNSPGVEAACTRALALGRQMGGTAELFSPLFGLWSFNNVGGQQPVALKLAEELLQAARAADHPALVVAERALGWTLLCLGRPRTAEPHVATAARIYDREQHHRLAARHGGDPGANSRVMHAWALWLLGYPDRAAARAQEALELAQELKHPFTLGYGHGFAAMFHHWRRQPDVVLERAEAGIALCADSGITMWGSYLQVSRGWALGQQGQVAEGLEEIRSGREALAAKGARLFRQYHLSLIAELCALAGEIDRGLVALDEALTLADETSEYYWLAELHRLRGELLLQSSPAWHDRAEACFQEALDVARSQEAKSLELRAAVSLARLWQRSGRSTDAHNLLGPVYDWFTEGFDTPDLQEARSLLDALLPEAASGMGATSSRA